MKGAPTLTPSQRIARDARACNVALKAGAGCGKTTVLTERFLAELDRGIPLRRIVAVTFTEKAARELRDRVRKAVRARLEAGAQPEKWKNVLRDLEGASITTIHSFCSEILRARALETAVEPGFEVLDAAVSPTWIEEAVRSALRRALAEGDDDLIHSAIDSSLAQVRDRLIILVANRSRGDLRFWAESETREIVERWKAIFEKEVLAACRSVIRDDADPVLTILNETTCTGVKMIERRRRLIDLLPRLRSEEFDDAFLDDLTENLSLQGSRRSSWKPEANYPEVKSGMNRLRDGIKEYRGLVSLDETWTEREADLCRRIARLAVSALDEYERLKRRDGLLDFDDLLLKTRDALRERSNSLLNRLRDSIDVLLIDEFQDTDPVQAEILEAIAGEDPASGRLFLVGDVKQSIYRFRGAQPKVFEAYRERIPAEGRLALTENFRSRPEIIAFVNALFAGVYPDPDDRLVPDPQAGGSAGEAAVEFLWPASNPTSDKLADRNKANKSPFSSRKAEAFRIACRIKNLIVENRLIRDRETRTERAVRPADIALLLRSLTDVPLYEDAFAAEGLNTLTLGGSVFYSRQEIIDLANLLSSIVDPTDEPALAGALRGPFFCASENALYWLAKAYDGNFTENFENWRSIATFQEIDRRTIARAHAFLSSRRQKAARESIAGLIESCVEESGYEAALIAEFQGERKRANVRKLIETARRFDRRGGMTLADFVARLRTFLDKPPREESAATTDEEGDAIRLMSIHAAKGLEFPVVIVPDLNRKARSSTGSDVFFDDAIGPVVRIGDDPQEETAEPDRRSRSPSGLGSILHKTIAKREEEAEAIRLFYVAATRARDLLIFSAAQSPEDTLQSEAMRLLAKRFDMKSGHCVAELGSLPSPPNVRVTIEDSTPAPPARTASRDASALSLSNAVLEQPCPAADSETRPAMLLLDSTKRVFGDGNDLTSDSRVAVKRLDLADPLCRGPSRRKLADLLLEILTLPEGFEPSALDQILKKAARSLDFDLPPRLEGEAFLLLTSLSADPRAVRLVGSAKILSRVPWSILWPLDGESGGCDRILIRGRLDAAIQTADGRVEIFAVDFGTNVDPRERLRLALSAALAPRLGFGEVDRAWLIRLDPRGHSILEQPWDARTIASLIEESSA